MAKSNKNTKDKQKLEETYYYILYWLIKGDRKKLNIKNKKLLKDFEKEVNNIKEQIFFLWQIKDEFLDWSNSYDTINENFDKLIYLINTRKELLHQMFLSKENIDEKYKIVKNKDIRKNDEKTVLSYEEIGNKVGLK